MGGDGSNLVVASAAVGESVTVSFHRRQVCLRHLPNPVAQDRARGAGRGSCCTQAAQWLASLKSDLLSPQGLSLAPRPDLTIATPATGDRLLSLSCGGSRLSALWSDGSLRCYSTASASTDAADEIAVAAPALELRLKGFCMPSGQQVRWHVHTLHHRVSCLHCAAVCKVSRSCPVWGPTIFVPAEGSLCEMCVFDFCCAV